MNFLEKLDIAFDPIENLKCQNESCHYVARTAYDLLSHYRKNYKSFKNFKSCCLYTKACKNEFKSVSALDSHLRRTHPMFFNNKVADAIPVQVNNASSEGELIITESEQLFAVESGSQHSSDDADGTGIHKFIFEILIENN